VQFSECYAEYSLIEFLWNVYMRYLCLYR